MPDVLNALVTAVPWPFPVRPSLDNLTDPEVRSMVATSLIQLGLAVLLVTISGVARRGRVVAALAALALVFSQTPTLGLLLVEAYPTSYRPSPTGFTAASIVAGRAVFAGSCVACHGNAGDGVGGMGLAADLRRHHIWDHPAGDLFWFVSHGITGPDGSQAMRAFDGTLSGIERWSAIDYVYALNAGAVSHGLAGWPQRIVAPEIALSCASISARGMADLRGKAIRVFLGPVLEPIAPVPPVDGIEVVTLWIPSGMGSPPTGLDCVALGEAAAPAYAILAGAADGHGSPARFLIDPEGVLRSVWHAGDESEWDDPVRLLDEVRTICTQPLTIDPGDTVEHHH
jgi:mono/diheme cytochrome c family protein